MDKPWYKSKTKVGGVLVGISMVTGGLGNYLTGDITGTESILQVVTGLGAILVITGIRDAIAAYFD
jgi:hypothetical protein